MLSQHTNSAAAGELRRHVATVEPVQPGAGVEEIPSELEALAEALRAAGRALAPSASRVVPAAEPIDPSVCSRYQRAAASWPTAPPPSHESSPPPWLGSTTPPTQRGWPDSAATRQGRTIEALLRPAPNPPVAMRQRVGALPSSRAGLATGPHPSARPTPPARRRSRGQGRPLALGRARRARVSTRLPRRAPEGGSRADLTGRAGRVPATSDRRPSRCDTNWCSSSANTLLALAERLCAVRAR